MIKIELTPKEAFAIRRLIGNTTPSTSDEMKIDSNLLWKVFEHLNQELRLQGHYPTEMDGEYIGEF